MNDAVMYPALGPVYSHKLDKVFRARSVALIGVSADARRLNATPLQILLKTRFPGRILLVNPNHQEIEGIPCYPDVESLPEPADVALVMVRAEAVPAIIESCVRASVGAAIVLSSGFEELEGGSAIASQLAAAAHGMALIGPNCEGIWSVASRVVLTFGSAARREHLLHAPIAIISQSGGIGGSIARHLQDGGIGCAYVVSVGNETQLDAIDIAEWMVEQPDVQVMLLFVEGLKNGERLLPVARRARQRGIQIVALKSGNSRIGRQAVASHTGKIATPYAIYRDVLRQAGVIQVHSLVELIEAAEVLTSLGDPRMTGRPGGGLTVFSVPGGTRALTADLAEQHEVPLARLDPETEAKLTQVLPRFGCAGNPTDVTGQVLSDPSLFDTVLEALVEDPNTEALVIQLANRGVKDARDKASEIVQIVAKSGVPAVLSFLADTLPQPERRDFGRRGIICARDPADALRYMKWLWERAVTTKQVDEAIPVKSEPVPFDVLPEGWAALSRQLNDVEIGTPRWTLILPDDDPAAAAAGLTFPLALKALPEHVDHKTEHGLVRLDLRNTSELTAAVKQLRGLLSYPATLLAQQMARGVEAILAVFRDPDFGNVLAIGSGGVGVELFQDIGYLALPVSDELIRRLIRRLKLGQLISGFRGAPKADENALVRASQGLATLFDRATGRWAEIEINPLIVLPEGQGALAVDILAKESRHAASSNPPCKLKDHVQLRSSSLRFEGASEHAGGIS